MEFVVLMHGPEIWDLPIQPWCCLFCFIDIVSWHWNFRFRGPCGCLFFIGSSNQFFLKLFQPNLTPIKRTRKNIINMREIGVKWTKSLLGFPSHESNCLHSPIQTLGTTSSTSGNQWLLRLYHESYKVMIIFLCNRPVALDFKLSFKIFVKSRPFFLLLLNIFLNESCNEFSQKSSF